MTRETVTRYREQWKLLNAPQRRITAMGAFIIAAAAAVGAIAAAEGNWLAVSLAAALALAEFTVILNVRSVAMWRHLYESQRDRPRAENWRQN
jgi:membrane protein YdbS with pleckstrin-like domain